MMKNTGLNNSEMVSVKDDGKVRDSDIRECVKPLIRQFFKDMGVKFRLIDELTGNKSRVDLAVLTQKNFFGYEIKSETDSLKRLCTQAGLPNETHKACYNQMYDYMMLIVHHSLYESFLKLPDNQQIAHDCLFGHWGIGVITGTPGNLTFEVKKKPEYNNRFQRNLGWFLWKKELIELYKKNGCVDVARGKGVEYLAQNAYEYISQLEIKKFVYRKLTIERTQEEWTRIKDENR